MTVPKITGLRSQAVNVPLEFPVRTAVGTVSTSALVLIDLHTDAGVTGHAYVCTYTPVALKPMQELLHSMTELIVGQALAPQALEQYLEKRFRLLGHTGLVRIACSGIDMAAWDALAKVHEVPLVTLLGGSRRPLPSYDSHSMDGVELAAQRASTAANRGFTAVKTKIGYDTVQADIDVVRSIRSAVGDAMQIMVDYNQALSVSDAIARGLAMQDEGVAWIEEPTLQHDYAGHARIAAALDVPVQLGENWFGPEEMFKSAVAGASDLAMPDLMKIGGVTGWLRCSALAQQFALPVSSHLFQEFSAHMLAVTPTAHWLERLDLAAEILEPTLTFKDGCAHIPDLPGAGIRWRPEQVARYSV
ncbi:MAG TPA: enolase C-terminal domain-like protein [Steroidobacteraceae bacterium]|nr:enolase C-terminal domain-like protein [Steroidobacteraceae bacterium]